MKNLFFCLIICSVVVSCSNQAEKPETTGDSSTQKPISQDTMPDTAMEQDDVSETDPLADREMEAEAENSLLVYFKDLTIQLYGIELYWNPYNSDEKSTHHADSIAHYDLDLGEWMYDKTFKIKETQYDQIELYVQAISHLDMSSDEFREVSLCVMNQWKSDTSSWIKIDLTPDNYKFDSDTNLPNRPITFTLDEYKQAVNEHCGESWFKEIEHIDNIEDLPVSEFTSQYRYKFVAHDTETGQTIERIICFYTPTSC